MKQFLKISFIALATLLVTGLISCSKDTDPADVDLFVGKYTGSVSFTKLTESKSNKNGSVVVSKVGDRYDFIFSDGIPSLKNVRFTKKDDNTYVSVDEGLKGITITKDKLNILVVNKDGAWTANCSR